MSKRVDPTSIDPEAKGSYRLQVYEECFAHLTGKQIKLLELGVYHGKSLLHWRDHFEKARIVGLDCNPVQIDDETDRIRVYVGYQQDVALLDRIAQDEAPEGFDVIIDDCSHIAKPTRISFWHLFVNHLKPGGIYAIEDIGTGYMDDWIDGGRYKAPHLPAHSLPTAPAKRLGAQTHPTESLLDSVSTAVRRLLPTGVVQSFIQSRRLATAYARLRHLTSPYRCRRRTPSHMYGMVGFAKELMDMCARGDSIDGAVISRIQVSLNQLIILKSQSQEIHSNKS